MSGYISDSARVKDSVYPDSIIGDFTYAGINTTVNSAQLPEMLT